MLRLLTWLKQRGCRHEDVKRTRGRFLYVECLKCGLSSPGVSVQVNRRLYRAALPPMARARSVEPSPAPAPAPAVSQQDVDRLKIRLATWHTAINGARVGKFNA